MNFVISIIQLWNLINFTIIINALICRCCEANCSSWISAIQTFVLHAFAWKHRTNYVNYRFHSYNSLKRPDRSERLLPVPLNSFLWNSPFTMQLNPAIFVQHDDIIFLQLRFQTVAQEPILKSALCGIRVKRKKTVSFSRHVIIRISLKSSHFRSSMQNHISIRLAPSLLGQFDKSVLKGRVPSNEKNYIQVSSFPQEASYETRALEIIRLLKKSWKSLLELSLDHGRS